MALGKIHLYRIEDFDSFKTIVTLQPGHPMSVASKPFVM